MIVVHKQGAIINGISRYLTEIILDCDANKLIIFSKLRETQSRIHFPAIEKN